METSDLGHASGKSSTAGDNPNKSRAKVPRDTRKLNRPRAVKQDPVLKWVDPEDTPSSDTLGSFTETYDEEFQVEVGLRPDFILPVVEAVSELLNTLSTESNVARDTAQTTSQYLLPLARCKTIKRLYATATDAERSELLKMKGLYYDTTGVPEPIYLGAAIVGSFDSKLGRVHVKNLTDYALRQAVMAVNELHAIDSNVFPRNIQNIDQLFWPTIGSLNKLRDEVEAEIKAHTFNLSVGGTQVPFSSPAKRANQSWEDYGNSLTDSNDPGGYVRSRCNILALETPGQMTNAALSVVGRRLARNEETKDSLGPYLSERFLPYYAKKYMRIVERFYSTKDVSGQYGGSPAQLTLFEDEYTSHQMLPQSDAATAFGWLFSPGSSVEFSTRKEVSEKTGRTKDRVMSSLEQVGSRKDL